MERKNLADDIATCMQLGMLLEVSAYPKPGNVHRTLDLPGTRYEHYLASSSSCYRWFRAAATNGLRIARAELPWNRAQMGEIILRSVKEFRKWQRGGNTSLGTVMLLVPLAVAAAYTKCKPNLNKSMRENLGRLLSKATYEDTLGLFEAIREARPGGLGRVPYLDVLRPETFTEIRKGKITPREALAVYSRRDNIAHEWVTDFEYTFKVGYPAIKRNLLKLGDINSCIVQTFLEILSKIPDTLIARKTNPQTANEVSLKASQILRLGGMTSSRGRRALIQLDSELHRGGGKLSPGATADVTAAALSLAFLDGFVP